MADALERLAREGLLAVAFDAPHHGERALPQAGLRLGGNAGGTAENDLFSAIFMVFS